MNLIEKLRAKQREFDRKRWADLNHLVYVSEYQELSDLIGLAADTLEGQALLIDKAQKPA